ncbi:sugar-binding domain-containing protein [Brevibacterium sp. RIT 803]|uniref:sugar-binding domain-containing protein n=1 Tax=Brevibacterium sp. RIT 803 TaxID=2810210 RepID=UPI00194EE201|nr:sugar-binding domain-containing protein [Brevibacterium sp. RIT 803]MBM6588879.1 hypothetical protein [Brevibacterium sp. RIT 803]
MDDQILTKVAMLYYQHEMKHEEIGRELGWNRVKVTRALKEARKRSLVEFVIHDPVAPFENLERSLKVSFDLKKCRVSPSFTERHRTLNSLGRVGAEALPGFLPEEGTVAVAMSGAVAAAADKLNVLHRPGLQFAATTGSVSRTSAETSAALAVEFARRVGGTAYTVPGPLRSSPEIAAALQDDPAIAAALSMAESASHMVVGVGSMQAGGGRMRDSLSEYTIAELNQAGAVGDIAARFFDQKGRSVHTSIDDDLLALHLEKVLAIPRMMVIAAGAGKAIAISTLLNRGSITDLVVDADLARALTSHKR